jgi:hypothetical protein
LAILVFSCGSGWKIHINDHIRYLFNKNRVTIRRREFVNLLKKNVSQLLPWTLKYGCYQVKLEK